MKAWLNAQGDKAKKYHVSFIAKCCDSEKAKTTPKPKPDKGDDSQTEDGYPNCQKFDPKKLFSDGNEYYCDLKGKSSLGKEACEKLKGKWVKGEKTSCGRFAYYLKNMGEEFGTEHEGYFKQVCCAKPSLDKYPNCPKFDAKRLFSDGKGYSCSLKGMEHLGRESCEKLKGKYTKDEKASCGEFAWYLTHMGEHFGEQHEGYFKQVCCTVPAAKICPESRPKFKVQSYFSDGTEWYCSTPGKHELAKVACEKQKGVWIKAEKTSCTDMKAWLNAQGDKAKMYRVDFIAKCCDSEKAKTTPKQQKCQKCADHTCDYWAEKENYSCKSLKKSYGCDCGGCECKLDKEVNDCKEDKCHGRTCVDWATNAGVSCSILKNLFQCTCKGCACPKEEDGKKKCSDPHLKGDGYCDDENNVESCEYDGGDCCHTPGKENLQQFIYCDACECRDPNGKASPLKCRLPKYQGDDHCDDGNNKASCDWDGGDCCGPDVNTKYCTDCLCLDPEYKGSRCIAKHMGDGFCDDANNNIKCSWDKGDCCNAHHVGQFRYCADCLCLDPTAHKESSSCSGQCGSDDHKGDQFCDDDNNNCACGWDGGDCCGNNGNMYQYKYCFQCACMDPDFKAPKCPIEKFKGDGVCDDENNIAACDFDGGDCCGDSSHKDQFKFCKKCDCLE